MSTALNECFGKDELITYANIEETKQALTQIYDDLELQSIQKTFNTKLTISDDVKETT